MNRQYEYLSDDDLELLIAEVEQNELVAAPPDLKQNLLESIRAKERSPRLEFYQYCFRVAVSAAAAVILVFALPELQHKNTLESQKFPKMEQEFMPRKQNRGFFEDFLNGTTIFDQKDKLGIFQ